jgi:hypothetical protein
MSKQQKIEQLMALMSGKLSRADISPRLVIRFNELPRLVIRFNELASNYKLLAKLSIMIRSIVSLKRCQQ